MRKEMTKADARVLTRIQGTSSKHAASLLTAATLLACLLVVQGAWAFGINPCLRELQITSAGLLQAPVRGTNACALMNASFPSVHEHMAVASIHAYRGTSMWHGDPARKAHFNYLRDRWQSVQGREHDTFAIIRGTWWNDDPLMFTWGEGRDIADGILKLRAIVKTDQPKYEIDIKGRSVPANQHLTRQSHYGQLQHLHFMTGLDTDKSTAQERVAATTERALQWLAFAYAVATRQDNARATDPLTSEMETRLGLPSIALNLGVENPGNLKIRSLFARAGLPFEVRDRITPDVALGSMLHVLQDSFSPAHACRVEIKTANGMQAVLSDVYNYEEQDAKSHEKLDRYPAWLVEHIRQGKQRYGNDPVTVGAWLLDAVDRQLEWPTVERHLKATVFASVADAGEDRVIGSRCISLD